MNAPRDLPDVLRRILAHKAEEVAARERELPLPEVRAMAADATPSRDFAAALRRPHLAIIAEIKRASPSEGAIRDGDFDPAAIARAYEAGDAAALSVLTDGRFFGGRLEDMAAAREACALPVLRKDFAIGEYQLYEARAAGADAVLLIGAALGPALLRELLGLAQTLGMTALVESHDARELEAALEAGARVLGINNRDLRTFEVDLGTTERLAAMVPEECLLVAESGVHTRGDIERLTAAGADAALIGTALMRADDPGEALRRLTSPPGPLSVPEEGE